MTDATNPDAIAPQHDELQAVIDGDLDSGFEPPHVRRRAVVDRARRGDVVLSR
jgi:hypothetical protein